LQDITDELDISETTRQENELIRQSQEVTRQNNETTRVNNENLRTSAYNSSIMNWLTPVATYSAIATTYTNPTLGDCVECLDTGQSYRWSGTAWKYFNKMNLSGYATQPNLDSLESARADILRESIHSGLTTMNSSWSATSTKSLTTAENRISSGSSFYSTTIFNAFQIANMVANINGYKINIDDGIVTNKALEYILPEPPNGTSDNIISPNNPETWKERYDLVFLECWFDSSNTTGKMNWRIRTVVGVNFSLYPEGLHSGNTLVTGMGGNTTQVTGKTFQQYNAGARQFAFTDVGLYIAGNGSTADKDALKTVDGYVYAIPLFMVKRRNAGGYSVLNPYGSINYITYGYNTINITMNRGSVYEMTLSSTTGLEVGKEYFITETSTHWVKIISIVSATVVRVEYRSTASNSEITFGSSSINNVFRIKSDRPDSKYANLIEVTDITDLRHKVPFSVDYESVMEENFFSLLRSELLTKEPKKMVRTVHGLPKTPIDSNHLFYASLDGTATAEVGGALTLGSGNFSPMPTGLGYKFGSASATPVAVSGLSASEGTIDAWINLNDFVLGVSHKGIVGVIDSSDVRFAGIYISNAGALTLITCNPDGTNFITTAFTGFTTNYKNFVHVRGTWSNTTGQVILFVNGKSVTSAIGYSSAGLSTPAKVIVGAYATLTGIDYKYTGSIADVSVSNIDRGSTFATLPYDFTTGHAVVMQAFNTQRLIHSDALSTQFTRSFANPVNGPASDRCITVTKGAGKTNNAIWEVTDTIAVKGLCGEIISGVIDTDTALTTVIENITTLSYPQVVKVSSVIGIEVNDQLKAIKTDLSQSRILVVSAIDAVNNTITVTDGGGTLTFLNTTTTPYLYEITASSSAPTVKFDNAGILTTVPGTWSNLGTNETTFTIGDLTSVPNLDTETIQIEYSLNILAGNGGISEVYTETLQGSVKSKKLIVGTVAVRDDFAGKVAGSTVVCPCTSKSATASALLVPTDVGWTELIQSAYDNIEILDGALNTVTTSVNGNYAMQLMSFPIIRMIEDKYGAIPALNTAGKVQWIKDNVSVIRTKCWCYGSNPSGNKVSFTVWNVPQSAWMVATKSHTASVITEVMGSSTLLFFTALANLIDSNGIVHCNIYADPSDSVTASSIYVDYFNIEIELKVLAGYDMLVPENPRRDDGLAGVLQVRKETKEIMSYFPLVNTDQVVTWGSYLPLQSLSSTATGKILAVSKFLYVTTSGTGGLNTIVTETFKALLKNFKLPSTWPIYLFNGSPVKLNQVLSPSGSDTSFKFEPIVSNYTSSLSRMTGADGATVPTFHGEDLSKVQNKVVLYPVLLSINSRLILRVSIIPTNSVLVSSTGADANQIYMDFDVTGKILVK